VVDKWAVLARAGGNGPRRAITSNNTVRKKVLQNATLWAMRAVFREVHPARQTPQNAFEAEEQALGDGGPNGVLRAFKTACTRISVRRPGLSKTTGGRTSCYPSPAGPFPANDLWRCSSSAAEQITASGRRRTNLATDIHRDPRRSGE